MEGNGSSRPLCIVLAADMTLEFELTRFKDSGAVPPLAGTAAGLNAVGGTDGPALLGAVPGRDSVLIRPKPSNLECADGGDEGAVSGCAGSAIAVESENPLVGPGDAGAVPGRLLSFLVRKCCLVGLGGGTGLRGLMSS